MLCQNYPQKLGKDIKIYLTNYFSTKKDIFYIFKSRFLINHKSLTNQYFYFYFYFYFLQNFIDFQRNIP